jgi:hypothetical protein
MIRIATLLVLLSTSACATIMAGGPDRVPVNTNPPGAAVIVDGVQVGVTPTTVTLDRGRSMGNIRLEMPGYAPVTLQRSKEINGWFWANLCLGGVIGIVVDLATGNVKRFDTTPVGVSLVPGGDMPPGPPPPGM